MGLSLLASIVVAISLHSALSVAAAARVPLELLALLLLVHLLMLVLVAAVRGLVSCGWVAALWEHDIGGWLLALAVVVQSCGLHALRLYLVMEVIGGHLLVLLLEIYLVVFDSVEVVGREVADVVAEYVVLVSLIVGVVVVWR